MGDDVRKDMERLHQELSEAAAGGDEHAREMLDHVGAYLESESPSGEEHEALSERLQDALVRFDTDHPTLAGTIQGVVDSLTAGGI